jgi:L,D-transpeptidase ErfK/SrfK
MTHLTRRRLLQLSAAKLLAFGSLPVLAAPAHAAPETVRHNIAGFRAVRWQVHFDSLRRGAIVCDTHSRALHYWSADEASYLVYPCSVPMSDDFARRGRTEITLKRRNPTWIPKPNMRQRNPDLPEAVPPGPSNPMGTRALNLSWQYYRIHGIDDPAKIGRRASNGCFCLCNHHVENQLDLVTHRGCSGAPSAFAAAKYSRFAPRCASTRGTRPAGPVLRVIASQRAHMRGIAQAQIGVHQAHAPAFAAPIGHDRMPPPIRGDRPDQAKDILRRDLVDAHLAQDRDRLADLVLRLLQRAHCSAVRPAQGDVGKRHVLPQERWIRRCGLRLRACGPEDRLLAPPHLLLDRLPRQPPPRA